MRFPSPFHCKWGCMCGEQPWSSFCWFSGDRGGGRVSHRGRDPCHPAVVAMGKRRRELRGGFLWSPCCAGNDYGSSSYKSTATETITFIILACGDDTYQATDVHHHYEKFVTLKRNGKFHFSCNILSGSIPRDVWKKKTMGLCKQCWYLNSFLKVVWPYAKRFGMKMCLRVCFCICVCNFRPRQA